MGCVDILVCKLENTCTKKLSNVRDSRKQEGHIFMQKYRKKSYSVRGQTSENIEISH